MNSREYFESIKHYSTLEEGSEVADLLTIRATAFIQQLAVLFQQKTRIEDDVKRYLSAPWDDIVIQYIKCIIAMHNRKFAEAFEEHHSMVQIFQRAFSQQFGRWSLPILYTINYDLRLLAIKSDLIFMMAEKPPKNLEIAARAINKSFSLCITDRAVLNVSRKWGTYYFAGLLFKTYFKLKQQNLCKNVIKSIRASTDLPPFGQFPRAHQVTFLYYQGLLAFLEAEYTQAEEKFVTAFRMCPKSSQKNKELILRYLIPVWLTRGILPSPELLSRYPKIESLYKPFIDAIRDGNVKKFDDTLVKFELKLVAQNTFLTVELAREIAMRVLFKKVYLINIRESKVPLSKFQQALKYVGRDVEMAEVMWYMASMIQKGLIRGYLSYSKEFLVLSEKNAFPVFDAPALT
ncbi:27309_t:CDS:10 [Gigaspora margarita]|uniref:Adaptation to pheromone during conjugation with cellular fusion-related protein n=2 Tax=Gigaspora margarita TaxID=4874 RepID=A0A8H4ADJ3_GIGMA|nr:adaptation to pheromone during conjugation with cellular fusion-related protein [Gigaspora margarita]CAG8703498.1 27309_t:CDS:10 [Gigaspora margarita]